jgi:hypothetical protein
MHLHRFNTDHLKKTKSQGSDGLLARRAVNHHSRRAGASLCRQIDGLTACRTCGPFFERTQQSTRPVLWFYWGIDV